MAKAKIECTTETGATISCHIVSAQPGFGKFVNNMRFELESQQMAAIVSRHIDQMKKDIDGLEFEMDAKGSGQYLGPIMKEVTEMLQEVNTELGK